MHSGQKPHLTALGARDMSSNVMQASNDSSSMGSRCSSGTMSMLWGFEVEDAGPGNAWAAAVEEDVLEDAWAEIAARRLNSRRSSSLLQNSAWFGR